MSLNPLNLIYPDWLSEHTAEMNRGGESPGESSLLEISGQELKRIIKEERSVKDKLRACVAAVF